MMPLGAPQTKGKPGTPCQVKENKRYVTKIATLAQPLTTDMSGTIYAYSAYILPRGHFGAVIQGDRKSVV